MRTTHTRRGMGLNDSGHLRATRVAHESKRRTHSADTNRRLRFVCERYVCVCVLPFLACLKKHPRGIEPTTPGSEPNICPLRHASAQP